MVVIIVITLIHLIWGASMLIIGVPRPFGSLEPYLIILDELDTESHSLGYVLIGIGLLACITIIFRKTVSHSPALLAFSLLPQQMFMTWGVFWFVSTEFQSFDARTWYGGVYQTIFAIFHVLYLVRAFKAAMLYEDNSRAVNNAVAKAIADEAKDGADQKPR